MRIKGYLMSDNLVFMFMVFITLILLAGCSAKEPNIVYKDVLIPVKCGIKMPVKPKNNGDFESHKARMIYYRKCESALKYCIGKDNE